MSDELTKAIQLPMWPEPVRGGPNALIRSAFFAGIHSKKRQILGTQLKPEKKPEGVTIASQEGITIKYAGVQLNQYDADVFFEALHRARHHPLETECVFTGAAFLRAIGRPRTEDAYEDLDESIDRLRRGTVELEWKTGTGHRLIFRGSLVSSYIRDETTKAFKITFGAEIKMLFAPASWTQLEWGERRALQRSPLAQWLHSYYSTHAAPYSVTVAFLHEKSGSPTKLLKHFKTELRHAFQTMDEKLGWKFTIANDLVSLAKPPNATQARHLDRRADNKAWVKKQAAQGRGGQGLKPASDMLPGLMKKLKPRK